MTFLHQKTSRLAIFAFAASCLLVNPAQAAAPDKSDSENHRSEPQAAKTLLSPHGPVEQGTVLRTGVTIRVRTDQASMLDDLVKTALDRDGSTDKLARQVKKYNRLHQKAFALTKDAINYVFTYRGDSPSSEMGDVLLNEKQKLKSRGSAEWLAQEHRDSIELSVVTTVMELAAGLGSSDQESAREQIDTSLATLTELVGEDAALRTLNDLKTWRNTIAPPQSIYTPKIWSISQRRQKQKTIMLKSIDTDPTIQRMIRSIHKYNGRSKLYLATSRVMKTGLGLASMSPTIVAPASQIALFFYTMATGGAEEDKMLKELYMDKRLASRSKVISEKSNLALEHYQLARLTRNPVLLAYCESIIRQMVGPNGVRKVLGDSVLEPGEATRTIASEKPEPEKLAHQAKEDIPDNEDATDEESDSTGHKTTSAQEKESVEQKVL